jgi:hypothetical protein
MISNQPRWYEIVSIIIIWYVDHCCSLLQDDTIQTSWIFTLQKNYLQPSFSSKNRQCGWWSSSQNADIFFTKFHTEVNVLILKTFIECLSVEFKKNLNDFTYFTKPTRVENKTETYNNIEIMKHLSDTNHMVRIVEGRRRVAQILFISIYISFSHP